MIIHNPKIKLEKNTICVSARIEFEKNNQDMPKTMWYRFPKSYKNSISRSSNGFVVSVLPLAMLLGEDIQVKGKLSPKLVYKLKEYQRILNFWYPKKFKLINIKYDKDKQKYNSKKTKGTMCAFSGGVDSFYTLWSHLPQNEPNKDYQITHALFIHGFDIPLEDKRTFEIAKNSYLSLGKKLNIDLIPVTTNAREFNIGNGLDWEMTHSSVLVGTALMFEKLISRFYFPENDTPDYSLPPLGIHPLIVPLFSTETFEMIPHGRTTSKLEKIKVISKWPETYDKLRVCWENPDGLKNCCSCWKCIYTMAILDMVNALDKYSTFPSGLERKKIRRTKFYPGIYQYYGWLKQYAKSVNRKDIRFDYTIAVTKSKLRDLAKVIKQKIV